MSKSRKTFKRWRGDRSEAAMSWLKDSCPIAEASPGEGSKGRAQDDTGRGRGGSEGQEVEKGEGVGEDRIREHFRGAAASAKEGSYLLRIRSVSSILITKRMHANGGQREGPQKWDL